MRDFQNTKDVSQKFEENKNENLCIGKIMSIMQKKWEVNSQRTLVFKTRFSHFTQKTSLFIPDFSKIHYELNFN